ncbi:FAD-binding oxidoreductase [Actinocorallia longicatena]|uniref:FAD-binding oxidoreductase n=1 Tax=Actinocorallia longicatena TaxID=111803 RepID=UPI0031CFC878
MHNAVVERRPAAVVYCRSEDEVRAVVVEAGEAGLGVVVRSTGHGVAGRSVADGAVVVDVGGIDHVAADRRRITVGGGAVWLKTDAVCEAAGVAVTGGTVSSTGVGGLTLGGGIGWLLPSYGLACDSLVGARVVTGNGTVIEADDAATPELMWALRGSGAGLGVVTEFGFRAHPLLPVHGGSFAVDLDRVGDWAGAVAELMSDPVPSTMLGPSFLFRDGVPMLSVDVAMHGPGPRDLARIDALRRLPGIMSDTVRPRSYVSLQTMIDEPSRSGLRSYWTAGYPAMVRPELIVALAGRIRRSPSGRSIVFLENLHGAYTRPPLPTSFPTREPRLSALITGAWHDRADDEANMDWIASVRDVLAPYLSHHDAYLNYSSDQKGTGRPDAPARLRAVRTALDPHGVFV